MNNYGDMEAIKRGHRRSALFTSRGGKAEEEGKAEGGAEANKVETSKAAVAEGEADEHSSPTRNVQLTERQLELLRRMETRHSALPEPPTCGVPTVNALQPEPPKASSMDLETLRQLKIAFEAADTDGSGNLDMEEFVNVFKSVDGLGQLREEQLRHLFMKIDANSDGTVDWDELTNHLMLEQARQLAHDDGDLTGDELYVAAPTKSQGSRVRKRRTKMDHSTDKTTQFLAAQAAGKKGDKTDLQNAHHQDMIEKMLWLPETSNYVTAGRDGMLWVWKDPDVPQRSIRNGPGWITDIAQMAGQPVAAGSLDRTISFYDCGRTSRYPFGMEPLARVNNLEAIPMALTWVRNADYDMLLWGDDRGSMNSFTLDDEWGMEGFNVTSGLEMGNKRLAGMRPNAPFKLHTDWITKVAYLSHSGCIVTSSMDSSLRMVDLERKKLKWAIEEHVKGVYSFEFCRSLNIIASCGVERQIMLWNPFTGKALGQLVGHGASVLELRMNEDDHQLISLAADKTVKVWDIRTYKCLQTIVDTTVYWPENKVNTMLYNPHRKAIVTASTKLKQWKFARKEVVGVCPIVQVLYNTPFRQVVTGDLDGTITVWGAEVGEAVFSFSDTHEGSNLSAMAFDNSQRRLITAARDGSIKMWNFNSGQCLETFGGFGDAEVSCLHYLQDGPNSYISAGGWNNEVKMWVDGDEVDRPHHKMVGHQDDILAMEFCAPSLATGAYDGSIILWKVDGTPKATLTVPEAKRGAVTEHRAIETLLFLPEKARVLAALALDATVYFWRLIDQELVYTLKTEHPGLARAMVTDPENERLYTADSLGMVYVWDLSSCDWRNPDLIVPTATPSKAKAGGHRGSSFGKRALGTRDGEVKRLFGWQAHASEVTSLSFAAYGEDGKGMLVTGAHDGLSRLWTLDGCLIGTFGVDLWQCDNPTTFVDEEADYRLQPDDEYAADPRTAVPEGQEEATTAVVAALRRPATATRADEVEEEELTQEEYERLSMQHKRAALYKSLSGKKGSGKDAKPPSNPFNAILDRRLKLKPIAPVEAPLANFKRIGLK